MPKFRVILGGSFGQFWLTSKNGTFTAHSDRDIPMLADMLRARIVCHCGTTDGSIDCEHRTVSEMIESAYDFLYERVGQTFYLPVCYVEYFNN